MSAPTVSVIPISPPLPSASTSSVVPAADAVVGAEIGAPTQQQTPAKTRKDRERERVKDKERGDKDKEKDREKDRDRKEREKERRKEREREKKERVKEKQAHASIVATAGVAGSHTSIFQNHNHQEHSQQQVQKQKQQQQQQAQQQERLKTIVRHLPPNLPEEIFWQSVTNWVSDETITWKAFYPGKFKTRFNKENIPARAYIAFKNEELLAQFAKDYDGHVFRDKAGNESAAVVEFAPFQKIPAEKKKPDARINTIEKDEDYISFVESLNAAAKAEPISIEALVASIQPSEVPKTTPLLEALKAEKSAQKDKDAILRNHAHHKDALVTPSFVAARGKEDGKKKGAATSSMGGEGTPGGKKGKKEKHAAAKHSPTIMTPPTSKGGGIAAAAGPASLPVPPKSPKAPKGGRPPKSTAPPLPQPVASKIPAAVAGLQTVSPLSVEEAVSGSTASTNGNGGVTRRTRPIIGLGRYFEAALSSAGVGPSERKSRREKEKETGGAPAVGAPVGEAAAVGNVGPAMRPAPPGSPKRERTARQRDAIEGTGDSLPGAVGDSDISGHTAGDPVGRGRGSRGRGRGRGRGPPRGS